MIKTFGYIHRYYYKLLLLAAVYTIIPFGSFAADLDLRACEYGKCTPGCLCDYQFDDMCAIEYGNYGWLVPDDADKHVYHHMRPESLPIEFYQIKPVGMRGAGSRVKGTGRGIAQILVINDDATVGQVYFEVHPDHLVGTGEISLELYGGGIDFGMADCAKSATLLSKSTAYAYAATAAIATAGNGTAAAATTGGEYTTFSNETGSNETGSNETQRNETFSQEEFDWNVFPFDSYNTIFRDEYMECHPRSPGAVVGAAEFTIKDPFYKYPRTIPLRSGIWYPGKENTDEGTFEYCIRVVLNTPNSTQGVYEEGSFIDAKLKIAVADETMSTKPTTSNSGQRTIGEVKTYTNQAIDSKTAYAEKKTVRVTAFLCSSSSGIVSGATDSGDEERSAFFQTSRKYHIGQTFRVCVGPRDEFSSDYSVARFDTVICENSGQTRDILTDGVPDMLTQVINVTKGFKNLNSGETISDTGTRAFNSLVTTGFLQHGGDFLVCTGEVAMEYIGVDDNETGVVDGGVDGFERRRDLQNVLGRKKRGGVVCQFTAHINLAEIEVISNACCHCYRYTLFIAFAVSFLIYSL